MIVLINLEKVLFSLYSFSVSSFIFYLFYIIEDFFLYDLFVIFK